MVRRREGVAPVRGRVAGRMDAVGAVAHHAQGIIRPAPCLVGVVVVPMSELDHRGFGSRLSVRSSAETILVCVGPACASELKTVCPIRVRLCLAVGLELLGVVAGYARVNESVVRGESH